MTKSLLTNACGREWPQAQAQKLCFKCGTHKPADDFYKHPAMGDGRLGKCKQCTKTDVAANYRAKRMQYSQYERSRFADPHRKLKTRQYQAAARQRNREKYVARSAVGNAVRDGRMVRPSFCQVCESQSRTEAHHYDYSKPLDVVWCCRKCHREVFHGQKCVA